LTYRLLQKTSEVINDIASNASMTSQKIISQGQSLLNCRSEKLILPVCQGAGPTLDEGVLNIRQVQFLPGNEDRREKAALQPVI
jgi:hypothetical protein